MSYSIPVIPRSTSATALQIVLGETTAEQIREFVGDDANVGTPESDGRDLRWIYITTDTGTLPVNEGDWIIRSDAGGLSVLDGPAFSRLYAPATDAARATLRAHDINDPQVQRDSRIAKAFAASLRSE